MSVIDDIAAVEADGAKPRRQKNREICALTAEAMLPLLQERVGQSWTRGNLSFTLTHAWVKEEGGYSWLCIMGLAMRNGVVVKPRGGWPLMYRNPPVGDGTVANLAALAQKIALDALV